MPYPPLKNPNTTSGQVFKEFLDDFKKESGISDEELQNDLKDPEVFKTLMSDFLTGNLGAKRAPGGTKYSLASGKTGQVTAGEPEWIKGPGGVATINPEKSKIPGFVNNLVAAGTGLALGGPGGAALNVGLQSTLGKDQSSGTGEALADNVVGGITSKFGGGAISKIPGLNRIPTIAKGALTGGAVGATNAAVQNANPDLLPYAKIGEDVQYDPQTGKPITIPRDVKKDALTGAAIGGTLGLPGAFAGKISGMRDSRITAKNTIDSSVPQNLPIPVNKARWNSVNQDVLDPTQKLFLAKAYAEKPSEVMQAMVEPMFKAERFKELPKITEGFKDQLGILEKLIPQPEQNLYPRVKKSLLEGLSARETPGSLGMENADSFREVFHNLGKETTEKLFGKGTYKELMTVLNSASRSMKSTDMSKYAVDNANGLLGGVKKIVADKLYDPKMFQDSAGAAKSELLSALQTGLGGGLGALKPGGLSPLSGAGLAGVAAEGTNLLSHRLPDNLANKLNRMSPGERKKVIEELLKYGQQPYSPLTTQLAAGNGNE